MTQNDIAYYNARKEAKDARLRRRETKRHNIASEATEKTKAAASYLSAQASQMSAAAAQENAATNRRNYELGYAREYGVMPGETPEGTLYIDVTTGEQFSLSNTAGDDRLTGYRMWRDDRKDDIIVSVPYTDMGVPNTYVKDVLDIEKGQAEIRQIGAETTATFWNTIKTGAGIIDTAISAGSNLFTGKKERNKKGGR